jgi:hypothetical protein
MNHQNLTNLASCLLWVIGMLLLSACQPQQQAHPTEEVLPSPMPRSQLPQISLDEPMTLSLEGDGPVGVIYEGEGPIYISANPVDADAPLDVVLSVLDAEFNQIAYQDDASEGKEQISSLSLPTTVPYTIQVDSFNGLQTGDVELVVSQPELSLVDNGSVEMDLAQGGVLKLALPVSAGTEYIVTARSLDADHDLRLSVYDEDGEQVTSNDDHNSEGESLGSLDARVIFSAEADVIFSLEITEFLGRATRIAIDVASTGS